MGGGGKGGLELGAQMLEVPNWQNLEDFLFFWHHLAFSGTVWSLNPNFDTEFRRLFFGFRAELWAQTQEQREKREKNLDFDFLDF